MLLQFHKNKFYIKAIKNGNYIKYNDMSDTYRACLHGFVCLK